MFVDWWHRLLAWWRPAPTRTAPAKRTPVEPAAAPTVPPLNIDLGLMGGKAWTGEPIQSAEIRKLERARRKHDKFVTPQGELPTRPKPPRPETQEINPKREPVNGEEIPILPQALDPIVVEPHHEDGGEVLFKLEEAFGEFNFRDTILQQLDRYFFYLKRMKKHDRDSYCLYSKIGATLLPYLATGSFNRHTQTPDPLRPNPPLPTWFHVTRPGFGCFAYGADPVTEEFEQTQHETGKTMWVPKFMYFVKYQMPPSTIQPMSGGDIYKMTIWWDRPSRKFRNGLPQDLPIFISKDGKTVVALKTLETRFRTARGRHGKNFQIPARGWGLPKEFEDWARNSHDDDIQHFLVGLFLDTIIQVENSRIAMVRIAVTKDGMTAVFAVNIRRTAYFFQDRDIQVTNGGTRKPVFHVVRPHVRSDGVAVKMHFRGARDFTWAGYNVHISNSRHGSR